MSAAIPIGRRIRARRLALGLSQRELADELDVTRRRVSEVERERAVPSIELVIALSGSLGVSTHYLLTGEPTPPRVDIGKALDAEPLSAKSKRSIMQLIGELTSRDAGSAV